MTQAKASARMTSSAPATFGDRPTATPTVTLELDGGDTFEAVFPTDEAVNVFMRSLQDATRRFVAVQDEDGARKLFGADYIKSAEITGVAHPPEQARRMAAVGEVVALPEVGGRIQSARRGENDTLIVDFGDGGRWEYSGVDADTFDAFINARSAGKFFDQSIRGKFAERQLP